MKETLKRYIPLYIIIALCIFPSLIFCAFFSMMLMYNLNDIWMVRIITSLVFSLLLTCVFCIYNGIYSSVKNSPKISTKLVIIHYVIFFIIGLGFSMMVNL